MQKSERFYVTMQHTRAALMACIQHDNECKETGQPCRNEEKCGCFIEAEAAVQFERERVRP